MSRPKGAHVYAQWPHPMLGAYEPAEGRPCVCTMASPHVRSIRAGRRAPMCMHNGLTPCQEHMSRPKGAHVYAQWPGDQFRLLSF